jgi:hypothetical protein
MLTLNGFVHLDERALIIYCPLDLGINGKPVTVVHYKWESMSSSENKSCTNDSRSLLTIFNGEFIG